MAPRRRRHSSSSESEFPSKMKLKHINENNYNNLIQKTTEKCEFCDAQFNNRYQCLIHTAKHIIIPLINNEIFTCKICLFCFTSQKDLTDHKKNVHPSEHLTEIIKHAVMNSVKIQCENLNLTPVDASQETADIAVPNANTKTKGKKQNSNDISQNNIKPSESSDNKQISNINEETRCDIEDPVIEMLRRNGINIKRNNNFESHGNIQSAARREPQTMLKQLLLQPNRPMNIREVTQEHMKMSNQQLIVLNQPIAISNPQINVLKNQTPNQFPNQPIMLNVPLNMFSQSNQAMSMKFATPTIVGSPIIINDLNEEPQEEFILPDITPSISNQKPQSNMQNKTVSTTSKVSNQKETGKEQIPNIKNRLIFEDDVTNIPNLTEKTYSTVKKLPTNSTSILNPNQTSHNANHSNGDRILKSNVITIINGVIKKPYIHTIDLSEPEIQYTSVHYDDLMRPGMFRCRHCGLTYPNRFDVIAHETASHLQLKNRTHFGALLCKICDWYIVGNHFSLKRHINDYHKDEELGKRPCKTCSKCKLKYSNKNRHYKIYHPKEIRSYFPNTGNVSDDEAVEASQTNPISKTVYDSQLCDVCSMFMKNNTSRLVKYMSTGVLQEYGRKYKCSNCKNVVDAVETFKVYRTIQCRAKIERRAMSNEDRLKKIQNRLRMVEKNKKF